MKVLGIVLAFASVVLAQQQQYTTPVPILKQINKHNEDGSYSYGYEGADGSFKIETKFATGEVQGKYGYVDDTGKLREIEYGASRRGFEPQGTDINVPPPTLNNNNPYPLGPNEEDDGQYREDPSIYYKDSKYNTKPVSRVQPISQPAYVQPQQNYVQPQHQNYNSAPRQYFQNNIEPQYAPQPQQQHKFHFQQQQQQQQPQQYYQPQPRYQQPAHNNLLGHPATNLDLNTGSYSLSYTG